uniref:Mitochondrial chaperone BCS1 n=1 Tax=Panagrellus redivivus TaxID=6233 RepID=A0A7E4WDP8_PANRE
MNTGDTVIDSLVVQQPQPPQQAGNVGFFERSFNSLSTNPLFSAGAGLAGLGLVASFGKRALIIGNAIARRKFISKLQITNEEPSYQYVLDFINQRSSHKTPNLTVNSALRQYEGGRIVASHVLLPGHGTHYFTYNYRWIQVERQREEHQIQKDGVRRPLETVTLTKLGVDPKYWVDFLRAATEEALSKMETGLVINKPVGIEWRRFGGVQPKRPLESVVLSEGLSKGICADLDDFLGSRKWYTDRGIPYRRGYLFYGPPGTGKTSFITALAAHYGYSICILSLSDRLLDDDRLCHFMNTAPPNSFILLEDVDAAFISKDRFENANHPAYDGLTRVTLSGLLNSIDGVASTEERILFMTTNHIDHLDAALIRPGRVDAKHYFGNCTPFMVEALFRRFYENVSDELVAAFRDKVSEYPNEVSPAFIQGHLQLFKKSPEEAIANFGITDEI